MESGLNVCSNKFGVSDLTEAIIECRRLNKRYGKSQVLNSVDFRIQPNQLVGFLGPNGAGKTTTIRILLGLLKPTSGSSKIFGRSCQLEGQSIRKQIGYLPGDVHFYPNLSGRQTLLFMANARRQNCISEIERLANDLGLELDKKVRNYSTGMRQKLGLIQAMMHQPQLLILDEPTSALDPLIRKAVFAELRNVVRAGRSVLFSSHSLTEVEELCDEVIILRTGKIVEQQKIERLKNRALRRVRIKYPEKDQTPYVFPEQMNLLEQNGNSIVGTWTGASGELIKWLSSQQIIDVIIEKPDLNDLFLTYYQKMEQA